MKTLTNICLLSIIMLTVACTVSTDEARVDRMAAEIADFELPGGYRADFSTEAMGYTLVSYRPEGANAAPSHLYLVQSEKESDGDKLAEILKDLAPGASDPGSSTTVLETRTVTIRDQTTTLVLSEGTNSNGASYLQATAPFQGRGGPALLVYAEPMDRWDEATLNALIASIR